MVIRPLASNHRARGGEAEGCSAPALRTAEADVQDPRHAIASWSIAVYVQPTQRLRDSHELGRSAWGDQTLTNIDLEVVTGHGTPFGLPERPAGVGESS